MRFRALSRVHTVLGVIKWVAVFVGALYGASLKASPTDIASKFGSVAGGVIQVLQATAWLAIPVSMLSIPLLEGARATIGSPKTWRVVRDVLDQFRSALFSDAAEDHQHEHRVTLFRWVRWHNCFRKWPWLGWLVPVERSGHTTQKTNIAFLAPDDADRVEGVAGMTWSRRQVVIVKDLPDLASDKSDAAIENYAKNSWMPPATVRARLPRSRSLVGIPVEVRNEVWGVIVVDSRRTEIKQKEVKKNYKLVARFLGKTLEGL